MSAPLDDQAALVPTVQVLPMLKEKVEQFKSMTPVVVALRNEALKPHHWEQIEVAINSTIDRGDNFTLGYLLELKVPIAAPRLTTSPPSRAAAGRRLGGPRAVRGQQGWRLTAGLIALLGSLMRRYRLTGPAFIILRLRLVFLGQAVSYCSRQTLFIRRVGLLLKSRLGMMVHRQN